MSKNNGKTVNPIVNTLSRKLVWRLGAIISVIAFLIYYNTVGHGYVLDDFSLISENSATVRGSDALPEIFQNFYRYGYYKVDDGLYRPLSVAMFALEWQISPNNPSLSHWVNVIFYALTGWILFITLSRLLKEYTIVLPFAVTLLFISHPVHTEVVANIKSRDELMCFFLSFSALYFILKFIEYNSFVHLVISAVLFFGSLMAKETSITMFVCFPLMLWFFTKASNKKIAVSAAFLSVSILVFLIIRAKVLSADSSTYAVTPLENMLLSTSNAMDRLATEIKIMGEYIFLLFFPKQLLYDRSYNQIAIVSFSNIGVLLSFIVLLAGVVFSFMRWKKKDLLVFGIVFFFGTIALFSNVLFTIGVAMADRFLYFASFGFSFFLVGLIIKLTKTNPEPIGVNTLSEFYVESKRVLWIVLPICLLYSIQTISRNKDWKDNYSLFSADLKEMPDNARAHSFLGNELIKTVALLEMDTIKRNQIYLEGISELKKAIAIYPDYGDAWCAVGSGYLRLDSFDLAEHYFKKALTYDSSSVTNLGDVYFAKGAYKKAIFFYKKELKMNPGSPLGNINLGISYGTFKQYDKALHYFLKADKLQPGDSQINFMIATCYQFMGNKKLYDLYYQKAAEFSNP